MLATYPAHRFNDTYTTVDEHSTHSLPPYHATPTPVWAPWSTVALDQQQPIYLDAEALSRIPRQHHQQQQPHPSGLMSESSSLQQPPIQFHPSTPGQFIPDTDTTWSTVEEGVAQLGQAMVQQRGSESDARLKMHQRAHSNSSIASTGPASPFDTNSISNPYIVSSNNNTPGSNMTVDSPGFDAGSPTDHNSKAVPTPSHTPLRQTYLLPEGDYSSTNMRRRCSMAHRRSTSLGDAPSSLTPATTYGEQHSESRSAVTNTTSALDAWIGQGPGEVDSNNNKSIVPKLQRTTTDAIEDELFPPTSLGTISTSPSISPSTHRRTVSENQNLLSPYRTVFNERMYAANQAHLLEARGSSPGTTTLSRERSPFRQGSPYAPSVSSFDTPSPHHHHHSRFGSLSSTGRGGSQVMEVSVPDEVTAPPRATISPRDVQLEFHDVDEDSQMPLFPPMSESNTEQLPVTTSTSFDFSSPPIPSAATTGIHTLLPPLPQQYPFIPHPRLVEAGNNNNNNNNGSFTQQHPSSDSIPEFPAHLTSMETSVSENNDDGSPPNGSQEQPLILPRRSIDHTYISHDNNNNHLNLDTGMGMGIEKGGGTYTCTYHGCSLRFDTPSDLQRHKRDGHRQVPHPPTSSTPISISRTRALSQSPMTTSSPSASSIAMGQGQAGPHRCDRINPSTNRPCATIFSRPYDLTRHEDTIHNARKIKARCEYCVNEEKTFSRHDALTRHMRVVHPEIEFGARARKRQRVS